MLAIRMQRTGRKGHAQFRLIVQDARRSPASGRVVAQLGHYNPHSKQTVIDKEKAAFYLEHGAQPSPRVTSILKSEKVKLPEWVAKPDKKSGIIRNMDKLRRNRPPEEKAPVVTEPETPTAEAATETPAEEATVTTAQPESPDVPAEAVDGETTETAIDAPEAPAAEAAPEATAE